MKIPFKSDPKYFYAEKNGVKNNTVRIFDDESDWRKLYLDEALKNSTILLSGKDLIEITNPQTGEIFFRPIKHVAKWKAYDLDIYIITWESITINVDPVTIPHINGGEMRL